MEGNSGVQVQNVLESEKNGGKTRHYTHRLEINRAVFDFSLSLIFPSLPPVGSVNYLQST